MMSEYIKSQVDHPISRFNTVKSDTLNISKEIKITKTVTNSEISGIEKIKGNGNKFDEFDINQERKNSKDMKSPKSPKND